MTPEENIFGRSGTAGNDEVQNHFARMKAEAVSAYEYNIYSAQELGATITRIVALEDELSRVCTHINMERERTCNLLAEKNIIE